MCRIYAHSVLGGKPVDYGGFDALQRKAELTRAKKQAIEDSYRAMLADDKDRADLLQAEIERIDAERRT